MTSIWLNRLSVAALIGACVLAFWLFIFDSAISFVMSGRDPFFYAETAVFGLLFLGPLAGAGLAFASRPLGLAVMTVSLLVGLSILRGTGCFGDHTNVETFACDLVRWQHVATVGLTLLSLLFRLRARRKPVGPAAAQ